MRMEILIVLFFVTSVFAGSLRVLWGFSQERKELIGLGWVRQSYTKIAILALSFAIPLLDDEKWYVELITGAMLALPWWMPWWGETNLSPTGRWPRWLGATVRVAWFTIPAVVIVVVTGNVLILLAGPASAIAYWILWETIDGEVNKYVEGPTTLGEFFSAAFWYGWAVLTVSQ